MPYCWTLHHKSCFTSVCSREESAHCWWGKTCYYNCRWGTIPICLKCRYLSDPVLGIAEAVPNQDIFLMSSVPRTEDSAYFHNSRQLQWYSSLIFVMYGCGSLWQAENSAEVLVNYKIPEYMIWLKIFLKWKCRNMSVCSYRLELLFILGMSDTVCFLYPRKNSVFTQVYR